MMNDKTPLEGLELPIELCTEYDAAAEWCAKRGFSGIHFEIPEPITNNLALKYILNDPESFEDRVRQFSYALSQRNRTDENDDLETLRTDMALLHAKQQAAVLDIVLAQVWEQPPVVVKRQIESKLRADPRLVNVRKLATLNPQIVKA